jgi:hypothetical protein
MRALVLLGAATLAITEFLSLFDGLRRGPLIACWALVFAGAAAWAIAHRRPVRLPRPDPIALLGWAGCCAVLAITAVTAAYSPPNSADAMAYHMPRVVYWAEQGSVRFFPTPYLNQIMLQPMAEYFMLHLYLLDGGDRWISFVQWGASLGCMIGVAKVAALFGSRERGQALAALFCATLPAGILAASGAKNDYVLALWLTAAVYFAMRFASELEWSDAVFLGLALGLALLTKGTAYLFAPLPLAAIFIARARGWERAAGGAAFAIALAAIINGPHYVRNFRLSGSVLGFDSAQGDGRFRWRNETFGWKQTVSNILRNGADQMSARSERWNQGVFHAVIDAHKVLEIDVNDPRTTWHWITYRAPRNSNHEADANCRWHLLILCGVLLTVVFRGDHERALYAASLVGSFVLFCAYLKWQPFMARLFLPLFVLGAPMAAVLAEWVWMRGLAAIAVALLLLNNARPFAFENWVRPLKGTRSVLKVPRDAQYFADMGQWGNREAYESTVERLAASRCSAIGIDANNLQLEYPLQALLRERRPEALFLHTGVENASVRYPPPVGAAPCTIVCLDCAGDRARLAPYTNFTHRTETGRFVLLDR